MQLIIVKLDRRYFTELGDTGDRERGVDGGGERFPDGAAGCLRGSLSGRNRALRATLRENTPNYFAYRLPTASCPRLVRVERLSPGDTDVNNAPSRQRHNAAAQVCSLGE